MTKVRVRTWVTVKVLPSAAKKAGQQLLVVYVTHVAPTALSQDAGKVGSQAALASGPRFCLRSGHRLWLRLGFRLRLR